MSFFEKKEKLCFCGKPYKEFLMETSDKTKIEMQRKCCLEWQTDFLYELIHRTLSTTAAVESLRNEVVKEQQAFTSVLQERLLEKNKVNGNTISINPMKADGQS